MLVEQTEIYEIVKKAVTDAIKQERLNLYFTMLPEVNDSEMQEIVTDLGIPAPKEDDEYIDITEFLANEN